MEISNGESACLCVGQWIDTSLNRDPNRSPSAINEEENQITCSGVIELLVSGIIRSRSAYVNPANLALHDRFSTEHRN